MITDNKVSPTSGVAHQPISGLITTAVAQTKTVLDIIQYAYGFCVDRVQAFCTAVTDVTSLDVRIARPGDVIDDVVLDIGTTKSKFKLTTTLLRSIGPLATANAIAPLVYKAAEDDIEFSSAFTITGGAADSAWGAVRVQQDPADGSISTRVVSANQAFGAEADALQACPGPANGMIDLGTITIEVDATKVFTAQTTLLDSGDLGDVNYNGRDSSAVSVLDAEIEFVANRTITGELVEPTSERGCAIPGGVLILDYTTDADGALTNGRYNVFVRPYPMYNEPLVPAGPGGN